jgi:hypothetical protein
MMRAGLGERSHQSAVSRQSRPYCAYAHVRGDEGDERAPARLAEGIGQPVAVAVRPPIIFAEPRNDPNLL